jgi:hypothetical protein
MVETSIVWPKRIRVERRIVNLLSRSLYSDFPRAIREIVSNAYDADATAVRIKIDLRNKEIVIEDNGNGMSIEQFDRYLRIAGHPAEGKNISPKFQRQRIGRFGVGFLASFPFCERLELTSKREGSDVGFTAIIPAERFVKGTGSEEEVSDIPVNGYNEPDPGQKHEHYTKIRMLGLTSLANEYFHKGPPQKKRSTIESWDGMERLQWEMCETLPLDFSNKNTPLGQFLGDTPSGMEIFLNGKQLFRNDPAGQMVASTEKTRIQLGNLEFRYLISTNWKIIQPVEARGLKIRIRNVGIGPRTYLDVEKEVRTFSHLTWLSGEVHVHSGLDESLALSRDTFTWNPDYQAFKEFFYKILTKYAGWVERVASAENSISKVFEKRSSLPSVSTIDIANESVKTLSNAGFEVVHMSHKDFKDDVCPVKIDKLRKIVTFVDDHPALTDLIDLPKRGVRIRYMAFNKESSQTQPVRLSKDGVIEVNTSYPVFRGSKTKSDILRRIHLILFMAKRESTSVDDMYDYLLKRLREEFES